MGAEGLAGRSRGHAHGGVWREQPRQEVENLGAQDARLAVLVLPGIGLGGGEVGGGPVHLLAPQNAPAQHGQHALQRRVAERWADGPNVPAAAAPVRSVDQGAQHHVSGELGVGNVAQPLEPPLHEAGGEKPRQKVGHRLWELLHPVDLPADSHWDEPQRLRWLPLESEALQAIDVVSVHRVLSLVGAMPGMRHGLVALHFVVPMVKAGHCRN